MEPLSQLFVQAGTLMLAGMVFVFVFLGLLVVFINQVLKRLALKYPDAVAFERSQVKRTTSADNGKLSPSIVAAISSAVSQYRNQHQNNK